MTKNKKDGTMAENDRQKIRVMHPHFQKVFNNNQPMDFSVLDLIKQLKIMWHLDGPITWEILTDKSTVLRV